MTIGLILLILAAGLIFLGAGQRVLDKLRLTDRQALLAIALMIGGGLLPEIPLAPLVSVNLGGALVPLVLCVWLWLKAGSGKEKLRSAAAALITAAAVWLLGRFMPDEPEAIRIDPSLTHGLAAGAIGYLSGRSRRGAFIAGVVGVTLASIANAVSVWQQGVNQQLVLGGAGAFDVIVVSGLLAVLLSELIGEITERIRRGSRRPTREFKNGEFVKKEDAE